MKIDGNEIANKILEDLKVNVTRLKEQNITPCLAIIFVGNDPASQIYINQKDIKAEKIGVKINIINLPSEIESFTLIKLIGKLNNDPQISGIIVQRPLPQKIDPNMVNKAISPEKDVDGFNEISKFNPPIFMAVMEILKKINIDPKEKNIAVVGYGEAGGQPIVKGFKRMGISPNIINSKTENKDQITKNADIVISAVGKSNVIKSEMLKNESVLIGIGLHKNDDGKLKGDYDENEIENIVSSYTPTPGGVGPINVAMLLKNVVNSAN